MFTVHRIAQGKVVEDWFQMEWLGVFQQLGIVSTTEDLLGVRRLEKQKDC